MKSDVSRATRAGGGGTAGHLGMSPGDDDAHGGHPRAMTAPATARWQRGSAGWPALGLSDGAPEQVGDRGHLEPGGGARGGALIAARQAPPAPELGRSEE